MTASTLPVFPVALLVASGIAYHLAQKVAGTSPSTSPFMLLAIAYAIAMLVCLGLALTQERAALARLPDRTTLITAAVIGLAALGVELGFLYAYRAGSGLGMVSAVSNAGVNVGLVVIGIALVGESASPARLAGVGLAAAASWMMVRG